MHRHYFCLCEMKHYRAQFNLLQLRSGLSSAWMPSSLADPSSVLCVALTLLSTQLYCPDSSACYTQPQPSPPPHSVFPTPTPNSLSGAKTVGISQQALSANWRWKILYQSLWNSGMEQLKEEARGRKSDWGIVDRFEGREKCKTVSEWVNFCQLVLSFRLWELWAICITCNYIEQKLWKCPFQLLLKDRQDTESLFFKIFHQQTQDWLNWYE